LLAMASVRSPSPASRLLQIVGVFGIEGSRKICRSQLAGDGAREIAIAGKPDSYRFCGYSSASKRAATGAHFGVKFANQV
jgi:hypothetical protein